ncbi:4'-phosphopantetheinyl transferase superfamily protein [Zafaria sp. Z1313]|uniref:4'-phosphopantetheinyl transferase superfamily protein n=1 Tax=unclassified Zafaria TaxID=2828765 RepID=UPI002E761CD9|nr:4'-phosphopantetheinyl transferase superfamily protein [Zafaria sp. J156]MEE1622003.1 4'-phosphopantetheinyl transferase superfamily protein [Zafaria sp. J156]
MTDVSFLAGSVPVPAAGRSVLLAAAPLAAGSGLPRAWLGGMEAARAAAHLAGAPRDRFTAGRLLVRQLASAAWGLGAPAGLALEQRCPRCGSGGHGRPVLTRGGRELPWALSYSRCAGWLLLAGLEDDAGARLGVDLADPADPAFAEPALDAVVLSAAERALLAALPAAGRPARRARWWAAKEALGKALGEGITGPGGPPAVEGAGRHPALGLDGALLAHPGLSWEAPAGLTAALVLLPGTAAATR